MSFSSEVRGEIEKLKVWDNKSNLKQEDQIARVCVREAFLQNGSISDPNKVYHLEFSLGTLKKAKEIMQILNSNGINAKQIKRREKHIVYIKEGEDISNCLAFIGASSSVLRFEEIRVMREMRNQVNRKVNCETANLTKTVNASYEQVNAINKVKKTKYWKELDVGVKEIAELRLENPELSIEALGKKLNPPISKSGANHRLRKIIEIANEIGEK
ncbi:MAG: DNA-binding protein WhiA [Clostridia bacterium]|nr:DNA-binding protein WhiA [Clostridia bacterium]